MVVVARADEIFSTWIKATPAGNLRSALTGPRGSTEPDGALFAVLPRFSSSTGSHLHHAVAFCVTVIEMLDSETGSAGESDVPGEIATAQFALTKEEFVPAFRLVLRRQKLYKHGPFFSYGASLLFVVGVLSSWQATCGRRISVYSSASLPSSPLA